MLWLQVALLRHSSVATQVRVASRDLPQSPFVTVLTIRMVTLVPSQTSEAVGGVKSHGKPHSTIRSREHLSTGGSVSNTVTVWLHVAVLVQESVARHVR